MITTWIGAAAVAAIAGAPHCLGMCGALACAAGGRPLHAVPYHLGRVATYAALGALAGAAGGALPGPGWLASVVAAVLLGVFALGLAGLLPEPPARWGHGLARVGAVAARSSGPGSRLLLGAVNGLIPCGLVYATLTLPAAAADPWVGALVMTVFGLATVPALALATLGLRRLLTGSMAARRVLAVVVLVVGLATLAQRDGWLASEAEATEGHCHGT